MIIVLSGTNRKGANTLKISELAITFLDEQKQATHLIDLSQLPKDMMQYDYGDDRPKEFAEYQNKITQAQGIVCITPEYNGSFPGVLKLFIDLLSPKSFNSMPVGFIGLASGQFGGLCAVEHLEMIFRYLKAYAYNERLFFCGIHKHIEPSTNHILNEVMKQRFENFLSGFLQFTLKFAPSY